MLPSGSAKYTNRPQGWSSTSDASTPRPRRSASASSADATTTWRARIEPAGMSLTPLPNAIEHAEPGGVTWMKRTSSLTVWSWSTGQPSVVP